MVYLVPPMDQEPPDDYVAFVADHLAVLQHDAGHLLGDGTAAQVVYPEALADVAGHWRRLRLIARISRHDVTADFLRRRLATRVRQWREDRPYEVEVQALRPTAAPDRTDADGLAQRVATLLPATARTTQRPLAEAAIAWSHAYERHRWHRVARGALAVVVFFGGIVQFAPSLQGQ